MLNQPTVTLNAKIVHGNSSVNISQRASHPAAVMLVRISSVGVFSNQWQNSDLIIEGICTEVTLTSGCC